MSKCPAITTFDSHAHYLVVRRLTPRLGSWRVNAFGPNGAFQQPAQIHSMWEQRHIAEQIAKRLNAQDDPYGLPLEHEHTPPPTRPHRDPNTAPGS